MIPIPTKAILREVWPTFLVGVLFIVAVVWLAIYTYEHPRDPEPCVCPPESTLPASP